MGRTTILPDFNATLACYGAVFTFRACVLHYEVSNGSKKKCT